MMPAIPPFCPPEFVGDGKIATSDVSPRFATRILSVLGANRFCRCFQFQIFRRRNGKLSVLVMQQSFRKIIEEYFYYCLKWLTNTKNFLIVVFIQLDKPTPEFCYPLLNAGKASFAILRTAIIEGCWMMSLSGLSSSVVLLHPIASKVPSSSNSKSSELKIKLVFLCTLFVVDDSNEFVQSGSDALDMVADSAPSQGVYVKQLLLWWKAKD